METRNAAGLQTAGAQMCRIATAAHCQIRMHVLLPGVFRQSLQMPTAGQARAIILLMIAFTLNLHLEAAASAPAL